MSSYEVRFWKIEVRKDRRTPYRVRWTVAGQQFGDSFAAPMTCAIPVSPGVSIPASRPTEVAAWAGHSVDVLMRVYAKCMTGLEDVWISRMDDTLHLEGTPRDEGPREDGPADEDAQK